MRPWYISANRVPQDGIGDAGVGAPKAGGPFAWAASLGSSFEARQVEHSSIPIPPANTFATVTGGVFCKISLSPLRRQYRPYPGVDPAPLIEGHAANMRTWCSWYPIVDPQGMSLHESIRLHRDSEADSPAS